MYSLSYALLVGANFRLLEKYNNKSNCEVTELEPRAIQTVKKAVNESRDFKRLFKFVKQNECETIEKCFTD